MKLIFKQQYLKILFQFLVGLFVAIIMPNLIIAQGKMKTVVIDAGHGGKDPGNLGTGKYKRTEKDIALDVSLQLGEYIEKEFPSIKVIYTRKTDKYLKLHERTAIANNSKADLFISIHCNSAGSRSAKGTETFVMGFKHINENLELTKRENSVVFLEEDYEENYQGLAVDDPESNIIAALYQNAYLDQSISFANLIERQFKTRVGRVSRGVKQSVLFVMNRTTMPSVLVELGFLTNREDEDFLHSEKGKVYMASGIFRAFKEYKTIVEQINSETDLPKQDQDESENKVESTENLKFYVQVYSSATKVNLKNKIFKGLKDLEEKYWNKRYKYLSGEFKTYEEAKKHKEKLTRKGFKAPFIVALDNEKPVPIQEAIKRK